MDKEDKLLKELVKEGFIKEVPADFTENVMMALPAKMDDKKAAIGFSLISYSTVVAAIAFSIILIHVIMPGFFKAAFGFIPAFLSSIFISLNQLFSGVSLPSAGIEFSEMFIGIILIVIALLTFDSLLGRKKYLNLFA